MKNNGLPTAQLILNPCYIVDVDGTFVLFSDKSHAPLFLNYLNRQHNNINFTMETENDRSLSFLDVSVCRNANGFSTSVFRKRTFSDWNKFF